MTDNRKQSTPVGDISRFTLSEDWLAVVVGLVLLALILVGAVTEDWLVI
jgi:hypothetical protein